MDIRDVIREVMKARLAPTSGIWNSEKTPNIYKLDVFLRKSGYRLSSIEVQDLNGKILPELIIEAKEQGYLYPNIDHDVANDKFYIYVEKYGELELSDVESIVQGYNNAMDVVRYLKELDLSTLEIEED